MRYILENYHTRKDKFSKGDIVVVINKDFITVENGYVGIVSDWRYKDGKYTNYMYYPNENGDIQYQLKNVPNVWFDYNDLMLKKDYDTNKFDL